MAAVVTASLGCASKPAQLPPNTVLDTKNHFLASTNYQDTQITRTLLIVTGIPEGPDKLADSTGASLDDFFALQDSRTACAQVYAPKPSGRWRPYRTYLEHALRLSHGPVDLVVYSAGAMGLMDLPEELWSRIHSLTFASPLLGANAIAKSGTGGRLRALASRVVFPSTDTYMRSTGRLVDYLFARGIPIRVSLGDRDAMLDNAAIESALRARDPSGSGILIKRENRPHGMGAADVVGFFQPLN